MTPTRFPLERYPLAHTRSIDEAVSLQSSIHAPLRAEQRDRRTPFVWRANGMTAGALGIVVSQYGAGVHAHTENTAARYCLTIPLKSAGQVTQHKQTAPLVPARHAALTSPSMPVGFLLESGYHGMQVVVPAQVLESTLDALTGVSRKTPLRFELSVDLELPPAAGATRLLDFVLAEADRDGSVLNSPLIQAQLAESFVCSLLLGFQHNHSSLLHSPAPKVEPAYLRRAEEYIAANAHLPVSVADLAASVGISAGMLFAAFRAHRGCSPMEFLRGRRFELARSRLLASSAATVAEIALSCGFEHLGRFSIGYRRRFGESPKQTLMRRQLRATR